VITGQGSAFCAGLDLPALADLDRQTMRGFIQRFSAVMLRIFELPIPLVAAVNGHAVAGGCVLALQADVRIGADRDARIGLNETQLGIGLPLRWWKRCVGRCPAPPWPRWPWKPPGLAREALQLGLLHEVVPEADLLTRALERATTLAALPPAGLRMVKESLRKPAAAAARANESAESERWLDTWFSATRSGSSAKRSRASRSRLGVRRDVPVVSLPGRG